MALTFAQLGFAATVTAASATPATDGYFGTFRGLPYGIHPTATPGPYAALVVAIAANAVTVEPYAAPVVVPPTLAQQATTALSAGLAIASTSTPALDATYAIDATTQSHMQAEMIALLNSGGATFADGTASLAWPDVAGENHTFTPTEAKALFLAAGSYVASLYKCINGTLTALPVAATTIA